MNTFKMNGDRETKANSGVMLPVVELVIAIGLFTVISIFIVRFFTSANTMSREADELSKGLIKAESAIELSKTFSPEEVAKELGGVARETETGKVIEVYYDKNWKKTDTEKSKYTLAVDITETAKANGILRDIRVMINKNDGTPAPGVIVDLEGAKYIKDGE